MSKNPMYKYCMRPLSPNIHKKRFIGFDVETYGKDNKFYSGGLYWYDKKYKKYIFRYFIDKEIMAKFMLTRKFRNMYIVATNLTFDFTVVFYDTPYWNKFRTLQRDGNILLASYDLNNKNGKIRFIDTSNYAPFVSVSNLGKIIGVDKLEQPKFLGKKPKNEDERLELQNYNMFDCKISFKFMEFFQDTINMLGGTLKLTIGSTSLSTYRMNYQKHSLVKESYVVNDSSIKDFIFEGYYGGRTEVFKRGVIKDVHYYDVNSLYPFAMKNNFPMPTSAEIPKNPSLKNIIKYEGVSNCKVTSPKINKPFLPYRFDGKLMFPTGTFQGTWNHNELRKAYELGYKIVPIKQLIYTETFRPFDEFVDKLYALRTKYKNEKNPIEFVIKILMNSLYGKFGMKKIERYDIIDLDSMDWEEVTKLAGSSEVEFIEDTNKMIIRSTKKFDGIYSFPIFASYVTSYARIHMYDFLKNENVVYSDTDSVISTSKLNNCSELLGQMKHEGSYDKAIFVKPKFYSLGEDYIKIKGLSKANCKDFIRILNGETIIKEKFSKLKESVKRGKLPNRIIEVPKKYSLIDNKRIWEHNNLDLISSSEPIEVAQ